MLRAILGVIVGYVVMAAVVIVAVFGAGVAFGDRAYQPGVWEPTMVWHITMFILGLVAAILGGLVCAVIARSVTSPKVLAVLVLAFGLLFVIQAYNQSKEPSLPRTGTESMRELMMQARTPVWVAVVTPVIGAVGVMIGAGMRRGPSSQRT
jgi:hypothetical protein